MKLIELIPEYLRDIKEYKIVFSIIDKEIEKLGARITKYRNNLYVESSDNYGVSRLEKIMKIASDLEIEDLPFRKLRILSRYRMKFPFTEKWLDKQLEFILGQGNYSVSLDYDKYLLSIDVSASNSNLLKEFRYMLSVIRPCNIVIKLSEILTESIVLSDEHSVKNAIKYMTLPNVFTEPFVTFGSEVGI